MVFEVAPAREKKPINKNHIKEFGGQYASELSLEGREPPFNLKARKAVSVFWPPFRLYARAFFPVVRRFF